MFGMPDFDDLYCDRCNRLIVGFPVKVNGVSSATVASMEMPGKPDGNGKRHRKYLCMDCAMKEERGRPSVFDWWVEGLTVKRKGREG